MGLTAVLARLPLIFRRIEETAAAAIAFEPDVVVIIDSPDFTHRVARRIRAARPEIPIIDYVSPSVWAWRPGRAKKMAAYVDHLLAILPFEPQAHLELSGPPCSYVGHPIIERRMQDHLTADASAHMADPARLLVLPGSRRSEISRLLMPFGEAVAELKRRGARFEVIIPAVSHLKDEIARVTAGWAVPVRLVQGEAEKFAEFGRATAALAASGTVTLELALAGTPMVVAYKLDAIYRQVNRARRFFPKLIRVTSMVLVNIILGRNVIPEFLDTQVTADNLADALIPLLTDTPARRAQVSAFGELDERMRLPDGRLPSRKAAEIVLSIAQGGGR